MRKILMVLIAVSIIAPFVSSGITSAQEDEVIDDVCPVMGGKVDKDTPYKVEYKGKTIGFCCSDCIGKFNADPEKYMAKLEKKKCVIKCPECGAEIDVMEQCKRSKMDKMCPMMGKM